MAAGDDHIDHIEHPPGYQPFSSDGHVAKWTGWDAPDEEVLTITWENEAWTASGVVGREQVHYIVRISPTWHVRQFLLFRDMDDPDLWLGTDGNGRWGEMNGAHRPELDGCVDLDLPCTPFTNTLPIRRLDLAIDAEADLMMAYVDFGELNVLPDSQRYTRLAEDLYRYESLDSDFTRDITVDASGFVVEYPGLFERV